MVFAYIRKRQRALLWIIVGLTVATFTVFSVTSAVLSFANVSREDRVASFHVPSGREVVVDQARFRSLLQLLGIFQGDVDREAVFSHCMLVAAAHDAGLQVSEQEINDNLVQMGTQNGLYEDDRGYRAFVRSRGLSPERFREFVGEQILIRRFVGFLEGVYARPTDDDYYQRFREAREEFRVTLLGFPYEAFAGDLEPETEDALRTWYEGLGDSGRKARFPAEPRLRLEAAGLSLEGLEVAELRARLGEPAAEGEGAEGELEDLARRLVQKALDRARALEREETPPPAVGAGSDEIGGTPPEPDSGEPSPLARAAEEFGLRFTTLTEAASRTTLTSLEGIGTDEELPEDLDGATTGTWSSEPRRSDTGFYVYHVVERAPVEAMSFEEAREKILEARREERMRERATERANEIRDRIRERARSLAAPAIDPIEAELDRAVESRLATADSPEDPATRASIEAEERAKVEGRIEALLREKEGEALDLVAAEEEALEAVALDPFPRQAPSGILGEVLPEESRTLSRNPAVTSLSPGQVSGVVQEPITKQALIVRVDGRRFPEREEMTPRDRYELLYQIQLEKYQQSQARWSYNELARAFDLRLYDTKDQPSS